MGGNGGGFVAHSWHKCYQPDTILYSDDNTPQLNKSHV